MTRTLRLAGDRTIQTDLPAFIMGIVNVTPDSFWDQSRAQNTEAGLARALELVAAGADIIDIGGESTRPGSSYVDADEEIRRVIPLVRAIRKESGIPVSVDTRKATVMEAALDAGADICNDISALGDDPAMAPLAARAEIPVILMHMQGTPESMQDAPRYADVVGEVADWLCTRAQAARAAGIAADRIIFDPGIGFGKTYEHNCALISGLAEIAGRGYPVLMALSRKSCIGQMTGRPTGDRLAGTLAANLVSVLNGATMLRVHDVAETRDSLAVLRETHARGIH